MRIRTQLLVPLTAAALAVTVFGVARAQQGPAGQPAAGVTGSTDASIGLQRPVNLTTDDMRRKGDSIVGKVDSAAGNVRRMLEQARAARDVVKTLCLNDKLTQLDVTLRSAKERRGALEAAANRRDNELAGHEFTILNVYQQRSDRVASEANQCIGSEAGYLGDTRITYTVDPTIPDGEGNNMPSPPPDPVLVPPATCDSCDH